MPNSPRGWDRSYTWGVKREGGHSVTHAPGIPGGACRTLGYKGGRMNSCAWKTGGGGKEKGIWHAAIVRMKYVEGGSAR
jgi:hypothetical protein